MTYLGQTAGADNPSAVGNGYTNDYPLIPVSFTDRVNNKFPAWTLRKSWPELAEAFAGFASEPRWTKTSAPLLSPTIFNAGHRTNENATDSGMIVLDSDGGASIDEIVRTLIDDLGVEAIVYSSARNSPTEPRWRLMLPLPELVDRHTYHAVADAVYRVLRSMLPAGWHLDTTKLASGNLFYIPGQYEIAVGDDGSEFIPVNEFHHVTGGILAAEQWIALADRLDPKPPEPAPQPIKRLVMTVDPGSPWEFETNCAGKISEYRSLSSDRNKGLFSLMDSVACSARWWRYDLSASELAGFMDREQSGNPPTHRYSWPDLLRNAQTAIDGAASYVREQKPLPPPEREWEYPRHPDTSLPWWQRDFAIDDMENQSDIRSVLQDDAAESADPEPHPANEPGREGAAPGQAPSAAATDAFTLIDRVIPPRQWLYGNVYCRKFATSTVGEGAAGKTTLCVARAVALATGRPFLGEHIWQRCCVLYITFEDDLDELARRIQACCRHHKIPFEELRGYLSVAGVTNGAKLVQIDHRTGTIAEGALGPMLDGMIDRHGIDLIILDPFIKTHGMSENDNKAIDAAASQITALCIRKNIAADAPHHMRKGGGDNPGSADAGRGGSAMRDAFRLNYTLTKATSADCKFYDIPADERWQFVRSDSGKVNITKGGAQKWFKLVSVALGNGSPMYPAGDEIQAIERWSPSPRSQEWIEDHDLHKFIIEAIREAPPDNLYSADKRASDDRAIFYKFAEVVDGITKPDVEKIITEWLAAGYLQVVPFTDSKGRKNRKGLAAGPLADLKTAPPTNPPFADGKYVSRIACPTSPMIRSPNK